MILKLDIYARSLFFCSFKIEKKEKYTHFSVQKKENYSFKEQEEWKVALSNKRVKEIILCSEKVVQTRKYDSWSHFLCDFWDVGLLCTIKKGAKYEKEAKSRFKNPQKGTEVLTLLELYLELAKELIKDDTLFDAFELIEPFFFPDIVPLKEFDEPVYRLKIYGIWRLTNVSILADKFMQMSKNKDIIIDMSNFWGAIEGTSNDFEPLLTMENARFIANKNAFNLLSKIGIRNERILFVPDKVAKPRIFLFN